MQNLMTMFLLIALTATEKLSQTQLSLSMQQLYTEGDFVCIGFSLQIHA